MSSLPKPAFIPIVRIERAMEEELARAGLMPKNMNRPAVDIEAFLESHLRVRLDQFADLEPEVLGVTHFVPGGAPRVEINRDLTEGADNPDEPWVKGRWRTTMAHEAGHVILHAGDVEAAAAQFSLFGDDGSQPKLQRCLKRDLHEVSARVDPREIQANYAMAALLMPREAFRANAARILPSAAAYDYGSPSYRDAVSELASLFQVSRESVRIRIEKLGLGSLIGQGQMKM